MVAYRSEAKIPPRGAAALVQRFPAAAPQTRPDKSGLKQCVTLFPHETAALGCVEWELISLIPLSFSPLQKGRLRGFQDEGCRAAPFGPLSTNGGEG